MRIVLTFFLLILFLHISSAQTEDFEDETLGSTTFTLGTNVFQVTGDLRISDFTNFSCNGFMGKNTYMDTGYLNGLSSGVFGSISHTNNNLTFTVSTTIAQCGWLGINDGSANSTGTIRFIGVKPDNTNIFEEFTLTSTDRNDFLPFTFSGVIWNGVALKSLQLEVVSGMDYWAMDNLAIESIQYLPVELISFEGEVVSNDILLKWETASEINNMGFEVEHSMDGENWDNIGFVHGNRTTTELSQYSFIINNPTAKNNYFRLKQLDFDRVFEYSNVVNIILEIAPEIGVFPNPTEGKITLYGLDDENAMIYITDTYGNLLNELKSTSNIDMSSFSAGVYFIHVETRGERISKRIIKSSGGL
ncbi:MAG: hypothetical protein ACI94Y_000077 [Maribacter sp.]|jgi:hypothetical protein